MGGGVTWLCLDAPHGSAFMPFFGSAAVPAPESFSSHKGYMSKFSTDVAWWAFNLVNQYTDLNFKLINKDVREKAHDLEVQGFSKVGECAKEASSASNPGVAAAECTNGFAEMVVAEWWKFAWSLFAKFGRYAVTESETNETLQESPSWWLESAEVGFTSWSASPKKKQESLLLQATSHGSGVSMQAVAALITTSALAAGVFGYRLGRCSNKVASPSYGAYVHMA